MWHELQQMNAADGILTILKQTQREEIRRDHRGGDSCNTQGPENTGAGPGGIFIDVRGCSGRTWLLLGSCWTFLCAALGEIPKPCYTAAPRKKANNSGTLQCRTLRPGHTPMTFVGENRYEQNTYMHMHINIYTHTPLSTQYKSNSTKINKHTDRTKSSKRTKDVAKNPHIHTSYSVDFPPNSQNIVHQRY